MGFGDKLKGMFAKKQSEDFEVEPVHRMQERPVEPEPVREEAGQRWLEAKKWREDKAMQEPLVKRSQFKKYR